MCSVHATMHIIMGTSKINSEQMGGYFAIHHSGI